VAGLLQLALSDGGQHVETLAWTQSVFFLLFAVFVWVGAVPRMPLSWPMGAMMTAIALSAAVSVRVESSIRVFLLWMLYLSLYGVTASIGTSAARRRVVDAVVVIGGWLCLVALFIFWGAGNPTMRWYSTFYWPNPFAGFLLLLLPIALIRFLHAREIRDCVAHGGVTLLLIVSLILTYSRGAWVSFTLTVPLILAVLRPPAWGACARRMAVLAVLVTAAVALLSKGTVLEGSMRGAVGRGGVLATEDLSIQGRLEFWRSGLRIFRDYPLLGTGAGTFGAVHPQYQRDARFYSKDAHNTYLQAAAEMGIVGVIALTAIVISVTTLWRRILRVTQQTEEYPIVAGIGLGLAAFALHSAVDMDWLFPANPAMAFALIGVLASVDQGDRHVERRGVQVRLTRRRYLAGLGLLLAVLLVQDLLLAHRHFVMGQRLAQNGQWAQAMDRYARAARLNPLGVENWAALSVAGQQINPPRESVVIASLHRAVAVDRMNAVHPLQLAKVVMSLGQDAAHNKDAEVLLHQAAGLDPYNRPEVYRLLAHLYLREARPDDASRVYAEAMARYRGRNLGRGSLLYLRLWPEVTSLFLDAADAALRRGNISQATEILRNLLEEDPASVSAAVRLATLYVQQGRSTDARRVLEAAATYAPESEQIQAALRKLP